MLLDSRAEGDRAPDDDGGTPLVFEGPLFDSLAEVDRVANDEGTPLCFGERILDSRAEVDRAADDEAGDEARRSSSRTCSSTAALR